MKQKKYTVMKYAESFPHILKIKEKGDMLKEDAEVIAKTSFPHP